MRTRKDALTTTFRRCAAIGASVMAAAAIGVADAGAASASTAAAHLCVVRPIYQGVDTCAYAQGSKKTLMIALPRSGMTNWFYPVSGYGQFRQANTQKCLQLDASAGNIVIEATCAKKKIPAYQLWEPVALKSAAFAGMVEYRSKWGKTAVCLTFQYGITGIPYLNDRGCSPVTSPTWIQAFTHVSS